MKLSDIANKVERCSHLQSKIDSGRHTGAEVQECRRLSAEIVSFYDEYDKVCRRCNGARDDHKTTCSSCRKQMD
jgi:hypothetical protein